MFEPAIDPVHWSITNIVSLGNEVIDELAKRASATVNAYQLTVGRCLLAIDQSRLHQRMGFSGAIHYATIVLGLGPRKACELRRVARELEELPRLSKAAELGQVSWGKLRAILSKASLETEEVWLRLASLRTCNEIEKLAASTERGKMPWETLEPPAALTRFQFHLGAEAGELFERVVQAVSQEIGKPMTAGEVIEHHAIERLAKRPLTPELVEATRKEARRGSAAAQHRHSRLIEEARQLVEECGLSDGDRDDALTVALGADCLETPQVNTEPPGRDLSQPAPLEILEVELDRGEEEELEEEAPGERDGPEATNSPPSEIPQSTTSSQQGRTSQAATNSQPTRTSQDVAHCEPREHEDPVSGQKGASADRAAKSNSRSSAPQGCLGRDDSEAENPVSILEEVSNPGVICEMSQPRKRSPELCPGRDDNSEDAAGIDPRPIASSSAPDDETGEDATSSVLEALINRALKERKLFLELVEDDWRNSRLRFNPQARFLTPAQRKELLRRDGYCCSNPGCPNHLWLEFHHVVAVVRKGKTTRYNLMALCSRCHRNVHQGFLRITGDAEQGLVFRDALGRDIRRIHAIRTADWLNLWIGWSPGRDDFHRPQLARAG